MNPSLTSSFRRLSETDLESGMFIYFVLIYCDLDEVKLASFHRSLVENKSIRTIMQAAKNNVELGSAKEKLNFKLFFEQVASIVGMDVDNILSAVSRTSQMNDMQRIWNGTGVEMKEGISSTCH